MAKGAGKRVLIIEDNYFMAQLLSEKIAHQGLAVTHAQDGQTGLDEMRKKMPDLVLLDLPLSGKLDGWVTLERIRSANDELPVLVLFNKDDADAIAKAKELGAASYLTKADVNTDGIVAAVVEL